MGTIGQSLGDNCEAWDLLARLLPVLPSTAGRAAATASSVVTGPTNHGHTLNLPIGRDSLITQFDLGFNDGRAHIRKLRHI